MTMIPWDGDQGWLIGGAVMVVIAAAAVMFAGPAPAEAQQGIGSGQAFNCSGTGSCSVVAVDQRPSDCEHIYEDGGLVTECQWTTEGVEEVSLVPGEHTYVDLPYRPFEANITYYETSGVRKMGDMAALPSGDLLLTGEHSSWVSRFDGESVRRMDDVDGVVNNGTNGLLGIAVDPDFEQNRYVYFMYTYAFLEETADRRFPQFHQRVSRFRLVDGTLVNETVLIEELPSSIYHSGGGLEVGPDGLLYVTVGDAHRGGYAQDLDRLNGKVLRIRRDGGVPASNPFNGSPVYSYGHRNPQTLTWGPDGQLYIGEHGSIRHDEINRIEPGHNYGWPTYWCDDRAPQVYRESMTAITGVNYSRTVEAHQGPYHCYQDWTLAPGAIHTITDRSDPAHGSMLVAGLHSKHLGQFMIADGGPRNYSVRYLNVDADRNPLGLRLRALEYVDGRIYVGGDRGGLALIERPPG